METNSASVTEAMEEQSTVEEHSTQGGQTEDTSSKVQSQQDSGYGSLECSSQGQSQKSYTGSGSGSGSGSGGGRAKSLNSQSSFSTGLSNSKSLNSSSSHSSRFEHDFRVCKGVWIKETKHKDHKKKKGKDKSDKFKDKDKQEKTISVKDEPLEPGQLVATTLTEETANQVHSDHSTKSVLDEKPHNICENIKPMDTTVDQPSLVYTQALNYIRKIKERSAEQGVPFASPKLIPPQSEKPEEVPLLKGITSNEGFSLAISMVDGSVLEVTPGVTGVIGFPKDMLLGQSFIDFVYPKDSINFYSKIIHGLRMPFGKDTLKADSEYGTSFYCRLRVYHSLKQSGFGIRNKKIEYKPCRINLKILENQNKPSAPIVYGSQSAILVEIIPIEKAYKVPEENLTASESFTIRHSVSCNFSEYSPEAIPFLGHLPQDLTGNSIFDCYHPEDLPRMKMIYSQVVKEQGKPYRSPPYRFKTFNNSWVTLETEWLCFVNPWTKKIDSIIGQHRVLKGPREINIFADPVDRIKTPVPDDVVKEGQKAQSDILDLLAQPVATYRDPCREPTEKRRRTLVDLMVPFVDQLDNMEKHQGVSPFREEFRTILSGRRHLTTVTRPKPGSDLPTLGAGVGSSATPPQQDEKCCDSTTRSSHTPSPLSYNNLNFNNTIERFFNSQPKTTISSDESGDSKIDIFRPESTDEGKSSSPFPQSASASLNRKFQSQSQSGSGSGDNVYNSASTGNMSGESGSGENGGIPSSSRRSYTHVELTEEVLSRHNHEQQSKFMEIQRKSIINKGRGHGQKNKLRKTTKRNKGVKRPANFLEQETTTPKLPYIASSACSAGSFKRSSSKFFNRQRPISSATRAATRNENRYSGTIPRPSLVDSVGRGNSNATFHNVMPPYYISSPTPESRPGFSGGNNNGGNMNKNMGGHNVGSVNYSTNLPVSAHQGYNPISSYMVSPSQPFVPSTDERRSGLDSDHEMMQSSPTINKNFQLRKSPSHTRRPDSQATSVKADIGSVKGSTTSVCGRHLGSQQNVPDCCRSYAEDTQPLPCNPSISIMVEAESIGSPGKEEKSQPEDPQANYTSSSNGSNGDKSSDDSLNNTSEIIESHPSISPTPKWNQSRRNYQRPVLTEPPWLDNIQITPELLYRYQLETKELVEVLRRDMEVLKKVKQPTLVEDQLASLYEELEIDGESHDLHLSEGITSSSSSGEEQPETSKKCVKSKKHTSTYYSKMAMIHEEDAPLPPSDDNNSSSSS